MITRGPGGAVGNDLVGSSVSVPQGADVVPGLVDALKSSKQEVRK